jgi:hypothetical protein
MAYSGNEAMGIGVTVARLTLDQLVQVRILDPQPSGQAMQPGERRVRLPCFITGLRHLHLLTS